MKGVLVLLVIIGVSTCLPAGSPDAANQDSQAIANGAVDSEMEDRMPPCIPGSCVMEITVNDRLGKKVRVKCNEDDTIGDLKKLIAAQTGTRWDKIVLKKWYTIFKDHIQLQDYEIHDGMNLELYYQ